MPILIFNERVKFRLPLKKQTLLWLEAVIHREGSQTGEINIIFCSDKYLLNLNRQYLSHDYLTDILTFDAPAEKGTISGDIFISIHRVRENAKIHGTRESEEIKRVMVHGVLHLLGYSDATSTQKARMRKKEDAYLSLFAEM